MYYTLTGPNSQMKIDPMRNFQQINLMKPGDYLTTAVKATYIESGRPGSKFDFKAFFTLEPNTVTIYPAKVILSLKPNDKGGKTQWINLQPMTQADYAECEAFIAKNDRYVGLSVKRMK